MTTPTVNVTIRLNMQNGVPCAGVTVHAKLDKNDIYQGFVISDDVSGVTDVTGLVVLALFPNAPSPTGLGTTGSTYRFTASIPGGKSLRATAQVPNSNCNLSDIAILDVQPSLTDLQTHITNPAGAHAASAVSVTAIAGRAAVNVQTMFAELSVAINAGGGRFIDAEVPTGTINGVNAVFTLSQPPSPALSLQLVRNGLALRGSGFDYTLTGSTVTYNTAPSTGDTHECWYRY